MVSDRMKLGSLCIIIWGQNGISCSARGNARVSSRAASRRARKSKGEQRAQGEHVLRAAHGPPHARLPQARVHGWLCVVHVSVTFRGVSGNDVGVSALEAANRRLPAGGIRSRSTSEVAQTGDRFVLSDVDTQR